jgi:hypothetical protein
MSELDFELFVVRTIMEALEDSYLSEIAIRRLIVAVERIAAAHRGEP